MLQNPEKGGKLAVIKFVSSREKGPFLPTKGQKLVVVLRHPTELKKLLEFTVFLWFSRPPFSPWFSFQELARLGRLEYAEQIRRDRELHEKIAQVKQQVQLN